MLLAPLGPCIPKVCSEGFLVLRADVGCDLCFVVLCWFRNENPFPSLPNCRKLPDRLRALLSASYLGVDCDGTPERLICFTLVFGDLSSSYLDLPVANQHILLDHV